MIKPETRKGLEELSKTGYAKILLDYFNDSKKELSNLQTIKSYEELLGRQWVEKFLDNLMSFLEMKDSSEKQRNPYI